MNYLGALIGFEVEYGRYAGVWSWLVFATRQLTEHDCALLTGEKVQLTAG